MCIIQQCQVHFHCWGQFWILHPIFNTLNMKFTFCACSIPPLLLSLATTVLLLVSRNVTSLATSTSGVTPFLLVTSLFQLVLPGLVLWHSRINHCLPYQHPSWVSVRVSALPLAIQLPVNVHGNAVEDDTSAWISVTHMRDFAWPSALATVAIGEWVTTWILPLSLHECLLLSFLLTFKQMKWFFKLLPF